MNVAKLNIAYDPSGTLYWQHGHSSEKSFIYVTTQHLTREQLTQLNDEVGGRGGRC
jgi:adenine-specific DNA-methyltransferase